MLRAPGRRIDAPARGHSEPEVRDPRRGACSRNLKRWGCQWLVCYAHCWHSPAEAVEEDGPWTGFTGRSASTDFTLPWQLRKGSFSSLKLSLLHLVDFDFDSPQPSTRQARCLLAIIAKGASRIFLFILS